MLSVIVDLERAVKELEAAPTSRAKSIAITHLQTAILWLQKVENES